MWEDEKHKYQPAPALADVLRFTDAELDLNRVGQLSPGQADQLLTHAHEWRSLILLVLIAAGVMNVGVILDGLRIGDTLSSRIAILGVIGAVTYGIYLLVARHTRGYYLDAAGPVASIQGRVRLDVHDTRNKGTIFHIAVADETFPANKDVFLAFKNDEPYALYFTPHTRHLLSAELLADD
jgi:hypothetical protein